MKLFKRSGGRTPGSAEHRQLEAVLARAVGRDLVPGIGMAHDAGARKAGWKE